MNDTEVVRVLASILLTSAPLIIAVCGETITERSGVINLSLDGSMLMAAMLGFIVALQSHNVWLGFLAGAAYACAVEKGKSSALLITYRQSRRAHARS